MKKVFILHDRSGLNFDSVESIGESWIVMENNIHPADLKAIGEAVDEVLNVIEEDDCILVTASLSSTVAMGLLCSRLPFGYVNILVFDSKHEKYIERRLTL